LAASAFDVPGVAKTLIRIFSSHQARIMAELEL
jgi:hypothetical protein